MSPPVSTTVELPQEATWGDGGEESTTVGAPGNGHLTSEAPVDTGGEQATTMGVSTSGTRSSEAPVQGDVPQLARRLASDGGVKFPTSGSKEKAPSKQTAKPSKQRTP